MDTFRAINLTNILPRWIAAAATLISTADASISIQSFSATTNDRFANDPSFVAGSYDWSGVGRDNAGHWVTMITPNVFLSATHFHPGSPGSGIGTSVTFHPGNDPSATSISGTVAGSQQIGGTDLWIGHFSSALPSSIAHYSTVTIPISSATFATSGLAGAPTFMSGNSVTSTGYGAVAATDHAVGTNAVEDFFSNVTVGSATGDTLVTVRNQPGDSTYGYTMTTSEAQLTAGDSGSPLMVMSGGSLLVAGIAWAIGEVDIAPGDTVATRDVSLYTYTGNYNPAIQEYIALHSVPEPSALLLLTGAVLLISRRR